MINYIATIRAISLIGLSIIGLLFCYQMEKMGMHSTITYLLCFIAIIVGIALLAWEFYSDRKRIPEPETPKDDTKPQQGISPQENQSLTFAGVGTLLILGLLHLLKIWKIESNGIWLFTGVFCGVAIAGFSLLYVLGYYIIYKPR